MKRDNDRFDDEPQEVNAQIVDGDIPDMAADKESKPSQFRCTNTPDFRCALGRCACHKATSN